MRHAIESGEKILHELCLQNTEFVVNEVCLQTSSIQLCYFAFRYAVVCQTGHDIHDHRRTLSLCCGLLSPLLSRPSHCFLCFPLPLPSFPFLPPLSILPTSLSSPFSWILLGLERAVSYRSGSEQSPAAKRFYHASQAWIEHFQTWLWTNCDNGLLNTEHMTVVRADSSADVVFEK